MLSLFWDHFVSIFTQATLAHTHQTACSPSCVWPSSLFPLAAQCGLVQVEKRRTIPAVCGLKRLLWASPPKHLGVGTLLRSHLTLNPERIACMQPQLCLFLCRESSCALPFRRTSPRHLCLLPSVTLGVHPPPPSASRSANNLHSAKGCAKRCGPPTHIDYRQARLHPWRGRADGDAGVWIAGFPDLCKSFYSKCGKKMSHKYCLTVADIKSHSDSNEPQQLCSAPTWACPLKTLSIKVKIPLWS